TITATARLRRLAQLFSRATSRLHSPLRASRALSRTVPPPVLQEPRLFAVVIRGMVRIWIGTMTEWVASREIALAQPDRNEYMNEIVTGRSRALVLEQLSVGGDLDRHIARHSPKSHGHWGAAQGSQATTICLDMYPPSAV